MCHSLDVNGMYAESLAISEKASQLNRSLLAALGYAYAKSGQRQKAEAVLDQWKEIGKTKYVANYWLAIVYAALGEKEAAFAELERSYQEHDWFLQRLKVDPFMDSLRNDPRFPDLVKRIGLPQ